MRRFWRFYFLRVVLVLVAIELIIFAWLQYSNKRPVANDDSASVYQRHEVKVDLLNNDTDKDEEDTLRVKFVDKPQHGRVNKITERSVTYFPDYEFVGIDSFKYTISDGTKESKNAYIKIEIKKNNAPVPTNDEYFIFPWGTANLPVLQNDRDDEGDSILIAGFDKTLYGDIKKAGNTLQYVPVNSLSVVDSFQYTISDGVTESEKATVKINIKSIKNSRFCKTPYYSDLKNYEQYDVSKWDISSISGNPALCINTSSYDGLSGNRCGAYNLIKNRVFNKSFDIQVRVKSTEDLKENIAADYAVYFAYMNEFNYCYASFCSNEEGDGFTGLYKVIDGARQTVTFKGTAFRDNDYHKLRIKRTGKEIIMYIDGKEHCRASDEAFAKTGQIGIGSYNDMACFDDISITGAYITK